MVVVVVGGVHRPIDTAGEFGLLRVTPLGRGGGGGGGVWLQAHHCMTDSSRTPSESIDIQVDDTILILALVETGKPF